MAEPAGDKFDISEDHGQHFMRLYMSAQRRLFGYVLSLVPNHTDADDIVQETVSIMWSKFGEYEPGTDFAAWALRIAHYRVLTYWKRKKMKEKKFSVGAIEAIKEVAESNTKQEDKRIDALRNCLKKLPERDRKILSLRYEVGATLKSVAERLDHNINTLYSTLSRIHIKLLNCIRRAMVQEEAL
jgi:RNA polymerase sigma-70 factor (ECF subfamily)